MSRTQRIGLSSAPKREDPELVGLVAGGDLQALGELYDRYARDVSRAAYRMLGERAEVEDLVHSLFLMLPRVARRYDGRASCRQWLCGIAVHLALRQRRGLRRFHRMLGAFAQTLQSGARPRDPEHRASHTEELVVFERALERLSERKRAAFVLVELEGLTADDAATVLEIPAATVRTRLFHARRELHAAMKQAEAT
jgi:RNA polymerase sigma-70 factor, ECF subfamily